VEALREQLEDLPLALAERLRGHAGVADHERRRERRIHERLARGDRADGPDQVLRRRALHHVSARASGERVREQPLVPVGREHHELRVRAGLLDPLDGGHAVDPGQPHVHQHHLGLETGDGLDRVLAGLHHADQLEVVEIAEQKLEALLHHGVVIDH
jgi:hypothetical protein